MTTAGASKPTAMVPGAAHDSESLCLSLRRRKTMKNDAKPLSRLKILFADDEPSLQELMSLELPRMGHEVTVCPDGTTAVAALERNTYDCLIVDLDMPGIK